MKDLKEALSSGRKPDITHTRTPTMVYIGRGSEYGDKTQGGKYERANYLRETESFAEDFKRFRGYLRAVVSHVSQVLDSMERHQANDPELEDYVGMIRAAYAEDTDARPGCPVGPSRLPHVAGAAASLNMAITQAVDAGLIPADPGQPWREPEVGERVTVRLSVTNVETGRDLGDVDVEGVINEPEGDGDVTLVEQTGDRRSVPKHVPVHLTPDEWDRVQEAIARAAESLK